MGFLQFIIIAAAFVGAALLVRRGFIHTGGRQLPTTDLVLAGLLILGGLIVGTSFGQVPAGYRGVVLRFGATTGEVKQPGLYVITPFIESVAQMNVQVQAYAVDAASASRDLQNVLTKVTLNYIVDPDKVVDIYNRLNLDYQERIIAPAIQESTKATTARFTAEELITKRQIARNDLEENLRRRLDQFDLHDVAMSITNFQFSEEFTKAIEAKVVAYQNFLKAQNSLKQTQVEAQQAIASARGDAEANRLRKQAISEVTIQYDAVQKWDGHLPMVMGGGSSMPFIVNLGQLTPSATATSR